ncbi:MAG: hypothetical protein AB1630_04545 [bacterium]
MKKKAILLSLAFIFLHTKGYGVEIELTEKFCPSLQFYSGDQGMSNASLLHMSTNPAFSLKSDEEGKLEEKPKKGRIIGAIIGAGIGAGVWYYTYYPFTGPKGLIFPAVIGSMIGSVVGSIIDSKKETRDKIEEKERR